jgi:methionyl-tRNA formyltransferase|tara:strand:- start:1485 stop:2462 length:978 start_codon:yes stop_codon:yes gene_type:complete
VTNPLRIIFAGTPAFAANHLQSLVERDYNVVGVMTQPDRPAGRGKRLQASAVKSLAEVHEIPVMQPHSLKDDEAVEALRALTPDVMVVVAYGLILPERVLELPRFGCLNVHASLLPAWRGAAPIHRAIASGDATTGVTIMQMDAGLDTGDMLLTSSVAIRDDHTTGSLTDELAVLGSDALDTVLSALKHHQARAVQQPDSGVSYAHKISKAEAEIDWSEPANVICRRIAAFNPAPVCFSFLNGQRVKLWLAQVDESSRITSNPPSTAGEIVESSKRGIVVNCGDDSRLVIQSLQLPGKSPVSAADALNGNAELLAIGNHFGSSTD